MWREEDTWNIFYYIRLRPRKRTRKLSGFRMQERCKTPACVGWGRHAPMGEWKSVCELSPGNGFQKHRGLCLVGITEKRCPVPRRSSETSGHFTVLRNLEQCNRFPPGESEEMRSLGPWDSSVQGWNEKWLFGPVCLWFQGNVCWLHEHSLAEN